MKENTILILGLIALVAVMVITGDDVGQIGATFPTDIQLFLQQSDIPFEPQEDPTMEAKIEVVPSYICTGESARGEITSNMPNGVCRIWINPNGNGWQHLMDAALDSSGEFQTPPQTINTEGYADFRGVCMLDGMYAITNTARLEVDDCGSEGHWICCMITRTQWDCANGYMCPNGITPINYYTTESACEANCGFQTTTTTLADGPYTGMPCSQVPPGTETCPQGACNSRTCTYVPADLVSPAKCECQ